MVYYKKPELTRKLNVQRPVSFFYSKPSFAGACALHGVVIGFRAKILKSLMLFTALFVLSSCSAAPGAGADTGGDSNSTAGKAFIAAIKGKLYKSAGAGGAIDLNAPMPVAENGDISNFGDSKDTATFLGAPSEKTAYYQVIMPARNPVPKQTLHYGLIIDGGKLMEAAQKKSADDVAKDLGIADWMTGSMENMVKVIEITLSLSNIDMSKSSKTQAWIQ